MDRSVLRLRAVPARRCPVVVGRGALAELAIFLADRAAAGPVVIVSDSNVAPLHGPALADALSAVGLVAHAISFPAGEAAKSRETKAEIEDRLARLGIGRDAWIVALGGGVTGDLAGFVAATWNRGIRFVQAPTSLLAMVDAAIGGKTAIDLPAGKNLVGAFHQPEAVFADLDTLATLPDASFRHGLAEVVKTATVADLRLFRRVERDAARLIAREPDDVEGIVAACARRKGSIVARDEREAGARAALNFGHTVGHALEAATGYAIPHGEAVAIGMAVESRIAVRATAFPEGDRRRLVRVLVALGLPVTVPDGVAAATIVRAAATDKKNRAGRLRFALPAGIGRMPRDRPATVEVAPDLVSEAWERSSGAGSPED